MVFELNIKDEHEFFRPRLEEELEGVLIFETKGELMKAKKIYDKLILEFKYDIEINRLEQLLYNNNIDIDYYKIMADILYNEYELKEIVKIRTDTNGMFLECPKCISYSIDNYKKKIPEYKSHHIKQKIINSDDYKIKKLNLLNKELNKYNILS